ncbi:MULTISPECIES: YeiH family protein [Paracoccus]|uniref:Putative sulfate exporter family transporter n=1 Tax=Paracoccus litorisediminis TaxID=2006130 RepID=A0A844HPN7_9RHOB|nr:MULTISPECIES: YeiH family protein [Paracoccus]MBD9527681.1 YeiH family putative sulfate export transporter [Paracoccus sp. PAR01]MTH60317.1 putative sulfate exporter family transporter [Paracoccus litorisediminis]
MSLTSTDLRHDPAPVSGPSPAVKQPPSFGAADKLFTRLSGGLTLGQIFPGLAVSVLVAATAQFLSEHYGAPAMLMALLLGLALNFLADEGSRTAPGIGFTARTVLRLGVALLGARISVEMLAGLGGAAIALVVAGVVLTILFALAVTRLIGRDWRFALLTGGAVAICGASAAMAIAAVLPRHEKSERDLVFTVLAVTVLSTVAMVIYPMLAQVFGLDARDAGVFLGGTIHDVAQVVGAGFSISPEAGETATLVKLIRVSMLAPVVLVFSLAIRARGLADQVEGQRPPLLPGFVLGFLVLAAVNSAGLIPVWLADAAGALSRWALLVAIAAVGIKTSLRKMMEVGPTAIALLVAETLFLGLFVVGGIHWIG